MRPLKQLLQLEVGAVCAGLVNCTTIDWFTEWPADALYEVASKQLADEDLGSQQVKASICQVFVTAHQSVADVSKQMLQELKRHNYVTPTNYLETVRGYSYNPAGCCSTHLSPTRVRSTAAF